MTDRVYSNGYKTRRAILNVLLDYHRDRMEATNQMILQGIRGKLGIEISYIQYELKKLADEGMINRRIYPRERRRDTYSLSDKALATYKEWIIAHD